MHINFSWQGLDILRCLILWLWPGSLTFFLIINLTCSIYPALLTTELSYVVYIDFSWQGLSYRTLIYVTLVLSRTMLIRLVLIHFCVMWIHFQICCDFSVLDWGTIRGNFFFMGIKIDEKLLKLTTAEQWQGQCDPGERCGPLDSCYHT